MSEEDEEIGSSDSDLTDVAASTKRTAAAARGYTFQDFVAGACILSVFFEDSNSVTIEWKFGEEDKFDDIILERDGEVICIQVKNGINYTLSSSDLTGSSSRGLAIDDLTESAKSRLDADEGSRFIVLTSFNQEPGSNIDFKDDSGSLSLLNGVDFPTKELVGEQGKITNGTDIEFILGAPGVDTEGKKVTKSIQGTDFFEEILSSVAPRLEHYENPEIDDSHTLIERAVNLARWARNQPVLRLDREEIVRRLELSPSPIFSQRFPIEEGFIRPRWINNVEEAFSNPDNRILVEGKPGSGKSTGIELLHRSWEEPDNQRTLRFYLYVPEDADSLEKKRSDPVWFRHQLAAQILNTFPEAFDNDVSVPVWTGINDLQRYIDIVGQWAEQNSKRALIIVDGLDHALREFGGTTATKPAEGTVLEEIGKLDFPNSLGLLMVSRPLSERTHETLGVDSRIDVSSWESDEIKEYLNRNDMASGDEVVDRVKKVSGGLPVIISHLLRKAGTHIEGVEAGLESALEEASHVDGELEKYYDTIWSPLEPYEQDAATLVALNPTGLHREVLDAVVDIPHTQKSISLDEAPLTHILDLLPDGRFRIFHDSFRAYTEDQLDQEEIEREHERLYRYLFDQCTFYPTNLESLQYHAENGPGSAALKNLATLDNLLGWWQDGVHHDLVSETLELAFDASLQDGDYLTAIDCIVLGGVSRNMLKTYLNDRLRLSYYISRGERETALRLVDQIRFYDGGNEEALKAMQVVSQTWEDELDKDWLVQWEEDYQEDEQPSWEPEAYFEVAATVLEPDTYWELAADFKRQDTGEHFTYEVLAAVEKNSDLLSDQPKPPEWIFENPELALEACEDLIDVLPDSWRTELREEAPDCSSLSLAGLHTLLKCDGPEDEILQAVKQRTVGQPMDAPGGRDVQFCDVYYVGSILAGLGKSPDILFNIVEKVSTEQERIQKLLAVIGAATTRSLSAETEHWVNVTLKYLEEILEEGRIENTRTQYIDSWRYRQAVSKVFDAFDEVVDQGSEDLTKKVLRMTDDIESDDQILEYISRTLTETRGTLFPKEELPEGLEQRYEEILKRPPDETPPSEELMDLGVQAAKAGYDDRAEKYAKKAVEHCFRYGYRKDMFLSDIWKGLEDIADGDWDRHLGSAIQLINWANLLLDLTDGKETHHFEGKFLKSLLNDGAIDYNTAEERARHNTTLRKLWDWRLRNPEGMTEEELRSLIRVKETKIRSSHRSDRALPFFAKAAEVADEFGWDRLVVDALHALNSGDYVRDEISNEEEQDLRDLASKHGVDIPDDLDSTNSTTDYGDQEEEEEEEDKIDEQIQELLSEHSEEDPLEKDDFEVLGTEELLTAGELLENRGISSTRYDPTAAAPIARILADRNEKQRAIQLLENVIAERDLMNWWLGGGHSRFVAVAEALIDLCGEESLQHVLTAWRNSRLDTNGYQNIFPQLVWAVKRTEGQIAAEELFSHTMDWMRRLAWPYENRVQRWGVLEPTFRD
ncbi:NACHT domain-containing protein [Halorussus halobius]|uniref:NACHT domain-containing protein n=1 Tax=Halorussus halobius TaxID=1710537 RepID=UPI0010918D52|nr:NACHT domain-containing protein [Halorussus halobius]